MKNLLIILFLPLLIVCQDSWVNVEFSFDAYADEVSWSIYNETDTTSVPTGYYDFQQPNAYQFVELNSGNYFFELLDSFGDGLSWPYSGWCLVSNECQDTLFYAEGNYGLGLIESLTIAPCAPPEPAVVDCMDENAINYNPNADINDSTLCEYLPCEGWGEPFATQICGGGQALVYYEWEVSDNPNCNVIQINYGGENTNTYTFDVDIDNGIWGVYVGNGQMPPNWEEEYSFQVTYADGSISGEFLYTPYPCTQGCTDVDAPNYNPWANVDDGSCGGQACDVGYTPITIEVSLDDWPSETGWSFVSGDGSMEIPSGTYNYQDIGQTFTYNVCAMEGGFEFIVSDTYGDGMAGSTTGGNMDGDVTIRGCDGEVITQLSNGDWVNGNQELTGVGFGSVAYSTWQQSTVCEIQDVLGCTNPEYQEFSLEANIDDGSCLTEHTYGCVDENSYNYNASATAMEIYPNCNYELWMGDAGADGWGNSFLGVVQGNNMWSFTMSPGQYEQTFPIWLETDKPVKIYYFEVGGIQTPIEEVEFQTLHNSFKLTNTNGDILLYEGWNPFADNGQGALQPFEPPLFNTYKALPFCGTYCIPIVEGCMNNEALNYCEDCNVDDGSCIDIVYGCANDLAFNYNTLANIDDGSCIPVIVGCMNNIAWNYNNEANVEDGSCLYFGCTDIDATNYNFIANVDNGSCLYPGCTDINALNYNEIANTDDGSCIPVVYGCTDELAFNYNSEANTDNESCIPVVEGCTNLFAFNYDSFANVDNGSCELTVYGCTDELALNYDPNANIDNGICVSYIYGCTNPGALNYNAEANTDDFSCILPIYGCMDEEALNYDENANVDNESCIEIILGCTDSVALNYNEDANVDDFSCIDPIYGCTDDSMFNYNELANVDNNTCVPFAYGCIDSDALNFDPIANTLDPDMPCCYVEGCMNIEALNYNEDACYDDGSCIAVVEGCMDNDAYNYNILANVSNPDDCLYDAGCYGGPGNPYWLNDNCYAWVIDVDSYCCDENWDESCQDMYNYCEFGWPISLNDLSNQGIIVYPNPTTDILKISTRLDIKVKVVNMKGKIIFDNNNIDEIDLSNYATGIYNLIIETNDKQYIKKIIKQ
tara:strand:+ start:1123 stop:4440 length:3318 start_codon:yes stop_codon:yes gene_type:complete